MTVPFATSFFGPSEFDLSQREVRLALFESGDPGVQQGDLVVDLLDGVLQAPALAPRVRFQPRTLAMAAPRSA